MSARWPVTGGSGGPESDPIAEADLTAHKAATTSVHGIADTSQLVLTSDARLSDQRTPPDGSVTPAKLSFDPATQAELDAEVATRSAADSARALIASPIFTGDPKAPTPAAADNDTSIATTAFVHGEVATEAARATAAEGALAPINSPTFTGDPKVPTAPASDNDTSIASTAYVQGELANLVALTPGSSTRNVIQPSGDFKALIVKLPVGGTQNPLEVQTSGGTQLIAVLPSGALRFGNDTNTDLIRAAGSVLQWASLQRLEIAGAGSALALKDNAATIQLGNARTTQLQYRGSASGGGMIAVADTASGVPLVVKGAVSQSVEYFDVQDSAAASKFKVGTSTITASLQLNVVGRIEANSATTSQVAIPASNPMISFGQGNNVSLFATAGAGNGVLTVQGDGTSPSRFVVKGTTSQSTTNYLEVQDSTAAVKMKFGTDNALRVGNGYLQDTALGVGGGGALTIGGQIVLTSASTTVKVNSNSFFTTLELHSNNAATMRLTSGQLVQFVPAGSWQTTVGAAGAASALPATPTKYLKVVDDAGTTLVIPAYAAV